MMMVVVENFDLNSTHTNMYTNTYTSIYLLRSCALLISFFILFIAKKKNQIPYHSFLIQH